MKFGVHKNNCYRKNSFATKSLLRIGLFWGLACCITFSPTGCHDESAEPEEESTDGGESPRGWSDPGCQELVISNLPKEWQKVKKIPMAMTYIYSEAENRDASQNEWADLIKKIHLAIRDGKGYVSYVGWSGCGDPYEAYAYKSQNIYRVLLSHAFKGFNACGSALYTYHIALGVADAKTKVELYIQEEIGEKITMLSKASAEDDKADCVGFNSCEPQMPCENEGRAPREDTTPFNEPSGQTLSCTYLDACGGSACVYTHEACVMQCGKDDCAQLESYPLLLSCR